jgi:transcriptional regulator with XRE-family HTH domain
MTYREIAARLGVTHQRVGQILRATGRAGVLLRCRWCRGPILTALRQVPRAQAVFCLSCLAGRPDAPFAERLRAHRLAAGLTLSQLAAAAGPAYQTLRCYERGTGLPRPEILRRLARVMGPCVAEDLRARGKV